MILLLSKVLIVKLMVDQLAKKFHTFYDNGAAVQCIFSQLYELHTAKILLQLYCSSLPTDNFPSLFPAYNYTQYLSCVLYELHIASSCTLHNTSSSNHNSRISCLPNKLLLQAPPLESKTSTPRLLR